VTFTFPSPGVAVPDPVVWGIAYNTTNYGYAPIGTSAACYVEPGGCGYDSLNVGSETLPPLIGTDVDPDGAYLNSLSSGAYCDSGGTGVFRLDIAGDCNTEYRPMAEFIGATSNDCKNSGWRAFTNPTFKNQGACVSYFNHL